MPETKNKRFIELQQMGQAHYIANIAYFNKSVSLIAFHTKDQVNYDQNNMFSDQVMPTDKSQEDKVKDLNYYPYFKPAISAHLVFDRNEYSIDYEDVSPFLLPYLKLDLTYGIYLPLIYASDFWVLKKHLIQVDSNFTDQNVTISVSSLKVEYFQYQ